MINIILLQSFSPPELLSFAQKKKQNLACLMALLGDRLVLSSLNFLDQIDTERFFFHESAPAVIYVEYGKLRCRISISTCVKKGLGSSHLLAKLNRMINHLTRMTAPWK